MSHALQGKVKTALASRNFFGAMTPKDREILTENRLRDSHHAVEMFD
jgi:hypothetical protein